MKKKLLSTLLASGLLLSTYVSAQYSVNVVAQETTTENHEHEDHEEHGDHEHEFEFDVEMVVKKDGDSYVMLHGDHYHKVPASELSEEQIKAADDHIAAHPELAEEYDEKQNIYKGYFEDSMIKDRDLSDWEGEWQSVYPYLVDGTLDSVMEMKANAEGSTMTAEEYKEYYTIGYKTDVKNINIKGDEMTFIKEDGEVTGKYEYAGYEILQYKKGNRGVRYLFTKVDGDEEAPKSVQFSDHNISPNPELMHYHIYFSNDDHKKLLEELENWPTYYPTEWNGSQILADQLNH